MCFFFPWHVSLTCLMFFVLTGYKTAGNHASLEQFIRVICESGFQTGPQFGSKKTLFSSYFCCSAAQLCPTLCDAMDCSTPHLPALHHLLKFVPVHVYSYYRLFIDYFHWRDKVEKWLPGTGERAAWGSDCQWVQDFFLGKWKRPGIR